MRPTTRPTGLTRALALATLAGVLLGATAACGSDDEGAGSPVTIRFDWWGNPDRAAVTEQAVDAFERKNPGIRVETSYAEFNAYFQRLVTQIAGGGAPDVLQMDYRYVREYADRGQLAPLDSGEAKVDTSGISPQLLNGGTIDGTLYGVPPTQNTQVLLYDAAQWERAGAEAPVDGWTWDDLAAAAARVSEATDGTVRGVADFGGIEDFFEVWLHQRGKALYAPDGALGYTAEDVAAWWRLTDGLRRSGAATPAGMTSKMDGSLANDPVTQRKASAGFAYDGNLTPQSWEIMGRELALTPFPSDTGRLGQYAKPAMMFSVSRRSKHKDAAARLVNFLINDQEAGRILGMSRGLPANTTVREQVTATLTGPPQVAYAYEQQVGPRLEQAPPPPPKGAGTVKATFQRVYEDVIFERSSVEDAAEKFVGEAGRALSS